MGHFKFCGWGEEIIFFWRRHVDGEFEQDGLFQPMEVYVDDEAKLTLHGLQQHYLKIKENEKNRKLFELLDALEFNQVIKEFSSVLIFTLIIW